MQLLECVNEWSLALSNRRLTDIIYILIYLRHLILLATEN